MSGYEIVMLRLLYFCNGIDFAVTSLTGMEMIPRFSFFFGKIHSSCI